MPSEYLVKTAVAADLERLESLINGAYRGAEARRGWTTEADFLEGQRTDRTSLQEILRTQQKTILCLWNDSALQIDGCVCVEIQSEAGEAKAYVGMLTVRPDLQSQGLGKKLLAAAEQFAREAGASKTAMSVIQIRDSLIAWYQRHGYTLTGKKEPWPYGDESFGVPKRNDLHFVLLEKQLPL